MQGELESAARAFRCQAKFANASALLQSIARVSTVSGGK